VWVTTFAGVLLLGAVGLARQRLGQGTLQHLSLGVFPFVVGLFALVQAVENLGLDRPLVAWLGAPRPAWAGLAAMTGVASLASAALNNLPATLLVRSVLGALHAPDAWMHAALLVLSAAARRGVDLPPLEVVKVALWLVPAMLVVGLGALLVTG